MTATEMIPAVGHTVEVAFESITVTCRVIDVKSSWGKPRLKVVPVSGAGSQWVELPRVVRCYNQTGLGVIHGPE